MKIAHFTDAFLPNVNGVSYCVDIFSQEQAKRHQVKVFAPAYSKGKVFEKRGKVEVRRYYSVPIPAYKEAHLTVPDFLDIYRFLHDFDPDIIHFHCPGTMGLMGILMAKILKKPLVGTYHTLFSEVLDYVSVRKLLNKYLVAIDKAASGVGLDLAILRNGENLKNGESTAQKLTWSAVNRIFNYADTIICPSASIERELTKRKMKKNKLTVISNGIDTPKFPAKKNYRLVNKILHVGRLGFEKNVDVVIRAFHEFTKLNPQFSKIQLIIAGDGPARKDLEKLAGELGIKNRVRFLGMIRREKLPGIYRNADMFVTASDMETLGMVALEAMASGLPVVAVNKYAMEDLVTEGENGFKVAPGDSKEMAEKILRLIADQDLRMKFGKAGREKVENQSTSETVLKMEELYKSLVLSANGFKV
jgi:glycosyltransferase involved in cell wall biosynthesis